MQPLAVNHVQRKKLRATDLAFTLYVKFNTFSAIFVALEDL